MACLILVRITSHPYHFVSFFDDISTFRIFLVTTISIISMKVFCLIMTVTILTIFMIEEEGLKC
ncbi:unnamed protein product [Heterobilharzia americana]|nr:unnamed protein product [Heterobilharzia americana]